MLWVHFKCVLYVITMKSLGLFNQSSQCSQHVITGFRPPCPQYEDNLLDQTNQGSPYGTSLGGPDHWFESSPPGEAIPLPRSCWPRASHRRRGSDKHLATSGCGQPQHPLQSSRFHDRYLGWSTILCQCFYKQKQRGELPQTLKGNVHSLMMGYVPNCPNVEYRPGANLWFIRKQIFGMELIKIYVRHTTRGTSTPYVSKWSRHMGMLFDNTEWCMGQSNPWETWARGMAWSPRRPFSIPLRFTTDILKINFLRTLRFFQRFKQFGKFLYFSTETLAGRLNTRLG